MAKIAKTVNEPFWRRVFAEQRRTDPNFPDYQEVQDVLRERTNTERHPELVSICFFQLKDGRIAAIRVMCNASWDVITNILSLIA